MYSELTILVLLRDRGERVLFTLLLGRRIVLGFEGGEYAKAEYFRELSKYH